MKRKVTIAIFITLCLTIALIAGCSLWRSEEPVARGPQTNCYSTSGGDKWICKSGGEFEVQSGGELDIQAGATAVIAAEMSHTGGDTFSNWHKVAGPTAIATSTPVVVIDSLGVSSLLEVRDAATPVFSIYNGGAWMSTGAGTHSSGQTINNWLVASAPTAIATATPAVIIDSLGVSKIMSVRDGGVEVLGVNNGGQVAMAVPTALATASPALVVDSAAVANSLEIRAAATPVFTVQQDGTVVGTVLQYGTSGERAVAASQDITGTAVVAHGLTTVTWAVCTLGEDPTSGAGDSAYVTVAVSGNVVTVKAWQDDFVTEATEADTTTHCLVIGTP